MKQETEAVEQKAAKGDFHEGCGGSIFISASGKVCLKCHELLGGQKQFVDRTPHRTANAGGLPARASHAFSSGRIV